MKSVWGPLIALVVLVGAAIGASSWTRAVTDGAATGETGFADPLGESYVGLPPGLIETGTGLGVILLGCWFAGKLALRIGLSKITGYLCFGVLAGPNIGKFVVGDSGSWVLSKAQVDNLGLVNDLAIALIALTAGGEIELSFVKKSFKSISLILAFEFTMVLVVVAALMTVLLQQSGVLAEYGGLSTSVLVALVIATVATANSPAVVMALLGETGASGPMARTSLAVTVCKDLLLIIAFAVLLALASGAATAAKAQALQDLPPPSAVDAQGPAGVGTDSDDPGDRAGDGLSEDERSFLENVGGASGDGSGDGAGDGGASVSGAETAEGGGGVVGKLTRQLGGSMVAGVFVGIALAWYARRIGANLPIVLVLGSFAVALISKELGLKTLIVGLTAGLTMANLFHSATGSVFKTIERLSLPVYAVFFGVAGTKVDPALFAEVWLYVVLLVVLRLGAVWGGTGIGCKLAGLEPPASRWIWTAFVPQAGISLALAIVVADQFASFTFADKVFNILLSAIAINELMGPVLFKLGLSRSGEASGGGSSSGGRSEG